MSFSFTVCSYPGFSEHRHDYMSGETWGGPSFQAFTHVALVNSAFNLTRFEKLVEQRAQPAVEDVSIAAGA
jgi:hypothetical protein